MSKNRLYVYTFIFFFMVCIGITAGSYISNINKKAAISSQTTLNPHANEISPSEDTDNRNDTMVLQMLFDLYATTNVSVDIEHAYANAIMKLQANINQPVEIQEQVIKEISTSLQKNLANYHTQMTSVQENVNESLRAFILANAISETDKKEITIASNYLDTTINTFAQVGHLILRDENPFAEKTINRTAKAIDELTKQRKEIQNRIEKHISQKLNDKNGNKYEQPAIESNDGAIF